MKKKKEDEERGESTEEAVFGGGTREEMVVVTWNVRSLSLRDANRRKSRMVAAYAEKCRCDVVLLSEVRAEEEGIVWLG